MGIAEWFMGNKSDETPKSGTEETLDISPMKGIGLLLTAMATSAVAKNAGLSDSMSGVVGAGGVATGIQNKLNSIEEENKEKRKLKRDLMVAGVKEGGKTYTSSQRAEAMAAAQADFNRLSGGQGVKLLQHKDLKVKARAEQELAKIANYYLTGEKTTVQLPYMEANWDDVKTWTFE